MIKSFRGISRIINRITQVACEATAQVTCGANAISSTSVVDGDFRFYEVTQHFSFHLRFTFTATSGNVFV